MTHEYSFSTLWGHEGYRADEANRPYANSQEAKKHRDQVYREFKAKGFKCHRWTLRGQLRQYWSFGVPCDDVCDVYKLAVEIGE